MLFSAGAGVPENVEPCVERRYFSNLHYLALTCADEVLAERLRRRPKWRKCSDPAYIDEHVRFNQWFKEKGSKAEPVIELLDTTAVPIRETVDQVTSWIYEKIGGSHLLGASA